ncbi:hypothetical protein ACWX0K_08750 [Nitrobacteraceae bacterium UC4446_H13]
MLSPSNRYLTPIDMQIAQLSIMSELMRMHSATLNVLIDQLAIDHTTPGRNLLSMARDGLIEVRQKSEGCRSKELRLIRTGTARLCQVTAAWTKEQAIFGKIFRSTRPAGMHTLAMDLYSSVGYAGQSRAQGS